MARAPLPRKPGFASASVVFVPVDARRLVTIGPDHPMWSDRHERKITFGDGMLSELVRMKDAIVRLQPPAFSLPEDIEQIAAVIRDGAASVKVMPAAPEDRVLVEAAPPTPESVQTIREVVYEMVTVARTGDRDLLVDVVEEALCAAGL